MESTTGKTSGNSRKHFEQILLGHGQLSLVHVVISATLATQPALYIIAIGIYIDVIVIMVTIHKYVQGYVHSKILYKYGVILTCVYFIRQIHLHCKEKCTM